MYLACDIGGTWIKTAFWDATTDPAELVDRQMDPTPRDGNLVTALIELLAGRVARQPVEGITVAIAANVDAAGIVRHSTNLPLVPPCPLGDRLSGAFGVPVKLENDANAAALAVARMPEAAELDPLVVVTLGTGVGGGIIVHNRLLTGQLGTAGEIGHLVLDPDGPRCACGKQGCLEALCGEAAILRRYQDRTGQRLGDARQLFQRMKDGDGDARAVVQETGHLLGRGLALISDIMAPRGFFLVGGLAGLGTELVDAVTETLARTCFLRHVHAIPAVHAISDDPWIGLKGAVERVR